MSGAPTVAIIGRPNVGKSTLFNRFIGRREAIVDDRPGVTRDRNFGVVDWNGRQFWLVDTGGLILQAEDSLNRAVRHQVEQAVTESDVVLFLVDVEQGVHPADLEIAQYLRKSQRPVILVANKADQLPVDSRHVAFYELGLGDPFPVSAAVGKSSGDLLDRVVALLPPAGAVTAEAAIDVAVVGRPNVGKSSLVNRLLGSERLVVAAEPGTTRDAIDTPLRYGDRTLVFIDTAGLRKRSKVDDDIEFYSTLRTARAIERADVCVLVVDAQDGMHVQDLKIANDAWERGAALIVAVNKWDLIEEKDTNTAGRGEREIKGRAPFLEFIPFIYVSAKTGQRTTKLLELILAVATERDKRIPTHEVNEVLGALVDRQQPPQPVGESVRLLYASQIGTAPPRFAIVSNRPEAIPESYTRYLLNGFREAWRFTGSPVGIKFRRKREQAAHR
ncbi:MAG: ribosome biogenesis GTPase Der [Gemmatimonadetes bacterium 13_2_20CM_69_27]|nr:MAG: ribosome biogenesis GTPase Der [Gemmatimonadetes bacterium 13_2_20CM_69_27]